jgi:hypothetical protein
MKKTNIKKIKKIEPIHKFNNGSGATLCNLCGVIISVGLTNDLFCEKHNQKTNKQD